MGRQSRFSPLAVALVCCLTVAAHAQSSRPQVCDLAIKREGLASFVVDGVEVSNGTRRIEAVRVGDGKADDELLWFCPGSGSIIPADPCTLELTLASSGKSFVLKEQRLHVVKYRDAFYAVTGWRKSETGRTHTNVYRIERTGFRKLC